MKQYLAIDYGTERIGVALNREWLAEPAAIFPTKTAIPQIVSLVQKEKIEVILIGIADGKMAEEARKLAIELKKLLPKVKFEEVDETLSSVETHKKLLHSGMPMKRRREPIDHFAAAAILQEYLDVHVTSRL